MDEKAKKPCYVIAEIGVNHNGDSALLDQLIIAAKNAGADACKFQTFSADKLVAKDTQKVQYQMSTTDENETHWEMLKALELSHEMHIQALDKCRELSIDFISTPYDPDAVAYLAGLGVKTIKTASADIIDHRIHHAVAAHGLDAIVAIGMASMEEVRDAITIYTSASITPTILHCVSNYPCAHESLNLSVMTELSEKFGVPVGFSDHSIGSVGAQISVSLGATVIEKHFTLDKTMQGPDHKASCTPEEFSQYVNDIRLAETILGEPVKELQSEEKEMHRVSRKSIVATHDIPAGAQLTEGMLTMMRPGTGLNGVDFYNLIGKTLARSVSKGEQLSWEHIENSI